jgi:hypothetical protein
LLDPLTFDFNVSAAIELVKSVPEEAVRRS